MLEGHRHPPPAEGYHRRPGIKLENVKWDLGAPRKITIDKDNTTIIEGAGKSATLRAV